MIRFGAEICQDLNAASEREWLETNGLGGFSSSTIVGMNTRRYHGLLTAALHPPSGRHVLLSKLEETFVLNGRRHELSTNCYTGAVHPEGYRLQSAFRLDPFPVFTWLIEDIELHKTVFPIHCENGVVVQYLLRAQGPAARHDCRLELRPLIAFRDFHQTTHANVALNQRVEVSRGLVSVTPYPDLPTLHFAHDAEEVPTDGHWYYQFEYARERERGLDDLEDLFNPFTLTFDLSRRIQATVIASTAVHAAEEAADLRVTETNRRKSLPAAATDPFIVNRISGSASGDAAGRTVIAGYHWFADWGRDTMISLPGLTLATGRLDLAREILIDFSRYISRGMLPNRFPEAGQEPEYNTVDATLWYFEAVRALVALTGDYDFVFERLFGCLTEIIDWHRKGTRYGIRVEADGLLHSGEPGIQLTWMDAKVGDHVVTERTGQAVEIQALWYNALCTMDDFASRRGVSVYGEMAARAKVSFGAQFWNEAAGCLYDVVGEQGVDGSIRPNQIFAIGLHHKILDDPDKTARVLGVVQRELVTPFGLRTLATGDSNYRGRYEGGPASRDGAYHQGTVWPWLMGYFIDAYLDANRDSASAHTQAAAWLEPLQEYAAGRGVNQICEIFDGDAPHEPRGCIAQAWSVAELIRARRRLDLAAQAVE